MAHMKRKRMLLMILLSLVGVLTLVVMFGIYAAFRGKLSKFRFNQVFKKFIRVFM